MKCTKRAKKFLVVCGSLLSLIAAVWLVGAIESGAGEPIVLLHGCPFSTYEYKQIILILARHHRVIAPDLLGLGDTIVRVVSGKSISMDLQGIVDGACNAGDPMIMLRSS